MHQSKSLIQKIAHNRKYIKTFQMQPFNCIVQRRIHCSPVRFNRPNDLFNTSRPKYPVTTTCLPFEQEKTIIYTQNDMRFPHTRKDGNHKTMKQLENSQSLYRLRQQQKHTIERRDKNQEQVKLKENDINQKLKDFQKDLLIDCCVDSEEYLRVWYQNLALKQKLRLI